MAIKIIASRLEGGRFHENITKLRWVNPGNGETGESLVSAIVAWIEDEDGKAYVDEGIHRVGVEIIKPTFGPKFLRTRADGIWKNNLLELERF
ncbi:DUF3892 domain-containing protein [Amycolatopsis regifaucium]|uniref:DUF3892 domain-containing protein n=1 Tax=Amycolatopsis regifaucium TaxID=546365 RepID=A0A154MHK2_9PSEU|nr:DUF3892 domain-containing protein [Amycolatopsis regifaucium]KZB83620.1 hypothetical protein AVL48_36085 [Amycolatopsis regifaucium]OKA03863.1 hypothetical protein ATP06_0234170 [Amycolatopsis regifaucium]SFJ65548.1 Protein of unknown function [Amycolatopsis regifaucium]